MKELSVGYIAPGIPQRLVRYMISRALERHWFLPVDLKIQPSNLRKPASVSDLSLGTFEHLERRVKTLGIEAMRVSHSSRFMLSVDSSSVVLNGGHTLYVMASMLTEKVLPFKTGVFRHYPHLSVNAYPKSGIMEGGPYRQILETAVRAAIDPWVVGSPYLSSMDTS